jgi:hypothetical protein
MEDPYDEFHVAHPLYLKGLERGIEQERERIYHKLIKQYGSFENPHGDPTATWATKARFNGWIHAMMIALDVAIDEYEDED